jgi:hypothetical protein
VSAGKTATPPALGRSAVVGSAPRQDAMDDDLSALPIGLEDHTPVAHAYPGVGSAGEPANAGVLAGIVCKPIKRTHDTLLDLGIETLQVLLATPGEADGPGSLDHARSYLRLMSSSGISGIPAAISSRDS